MRFCLAVLLSAALFALAACGDDDDDGDSAATTETPATETSSQDQADIEAVLTDYYAASTPTDICAFMTRGMQAGLSGPGARVGNPGKPAGEGCEAAVKKAVDEGMFSLEPTEPEIEAVAVTGNLAAARVENEGGAGPEAYGVFLVKTGGDWLIHGEQQPPPGYEDLAEQVAD